MPRRAVLPAALAIALLAATAPAAPAAAAKRCRSGDLRYAFAAGQPKVFGVHALRITGGSCATAHRVAKHWMTRFEAALQAGAVKLPKHVDGFAFKTLPPRASQTYGERGRRGATTIRFDYLVPNG